jgi:N-acylneuraminate cytidylyltransferase
MICIIPARGNSKRLPGKNIRALDGEPIINRVIKIAKDSGLFEMIVVSTDSQQISDIVQGAVVNMRPPELCGDIPEDLVNIHTAKDYGAESFCRIYPFAALLTPERLCKGYKEFLTGKYENVHECQKYTHLTQRAIELDTTGLMYEGYRHPVYVSMPTEMLKPYYHEAGTYMFTTLKALDEALEYRQIKWMPVSELEAQDIDDEIDWKMLELKWQYKQGN